MKEMPENNIERPEGEKKYTMEDFLAEMRELKRKQEKKHISQDLVETELEKLTEEDMQMWRTIKEWKENPLSSEKMQKQVDEYFQKFIGENGGLRKGTESRYAFCKFVRGADGAGDVIVTKQLQEMREGRKL